MGETSRRAFLAAAPAAALLTGRVEALPVIGGLALLGKELERLWDAERHALAMGADDECGKACAATCDVVTQILHVPAKTLDDFKVKARAVWYFTDRGEYLFDVVETTGEKLVLSMLRELAEGGRP